MTQQVVCWELNGPGATVKCGALQGFARYDSDGLDFVVTKWNQRPAPGLSIFCSPGPAQLSGQMAVTERYIRGQDFIASGSPAGAQQIAPHVYWRSAWHEGRKAARLELVLSAQTDLLDSAPSWPIISCVRDATLLHRDLQRDTDFKDISGVAANFTSPASNEQLFLFRIPSLGFSFAQMVHPSDFVSADVPLDGQPLLVVDSVLFPERLEKGVIRRGRICGWFMPIDNDLENAAQLAREFVDEPLPLTT
jgi:hypothetical protein